MGDNEPCCMTCGDGQNYIDPGSGLCDVCAVTKREADRPYYTRFPIATTLSATDPEQNPAHASMTARRFSTAVPRR
jgi:hypothetical protein